MQKNRLARRRQELIARCAEQRRGATTHGQAISASMTGLDTAWHYIERIKRHPAWIAGFVIGIVLINPRRLATLGRNSAFALQIWRRVTPIIQGLRTRR